MSAALAVYHYINVFLGVLNIHYSPASNRYNLYHWPTMIYCGLMNLFGVICLHGANYVFLEFALICREYELTQILDIVLILIDHLVMVVFFAESWLKRAAVFAICNDLQTLFEQFSEHLRADENRQLRQTVRNILITKCLCAVAIICYQLYQINEVPQCEAIDRRYLEASHFFGELVFFCVYVVDMNVYLSWTFIYMCEEALQQRVRQTSKDARLMFYLQLNRRADQALLPATFAKWRRKLGRTIMEISRLQSKLSSLAERIFHTFQLQFLLFCISFFVNLIYLMVFGYLIFAKFDELDTQYLLIFVVTSGIKILNIFIFFSMYELLSKSFNNMGCLVHKIEVYASVARRRPSLQDEFDKNLELLMLQVQPHRFSASIYGLFEINNSTGLDLLESSLTSVISLIQILAEL